MRYRNPSQQLYVRQFDYGHVDDGCSVAINSTAESGLEFQSDVEEMGISRVLKMLEE
jgi:hypothetical protein